MTVIVTRQHYMYKADEVGLLGGNPKLSQLHSPYIMRNIEDASM